MSDERRKTDIERPVYEPPAVRSLGGVAELTSDEPGSITKTKTISDGRLKVQVQPVGDSVERLRSLADEAAYEPPAARGLGSVTELTGGLDDRTSSVVLDESDERLKVEVRPVADAVERLRFLARP